MFKVLKSSQTHHTQAHTNPLASGVNIRHGMSFRETTYIFLGAELQAACPVDSPHVCSGHLEDVQFERLLNEDEVVVSHAEAVVVAGREEGAAGNRADHLHILQCGDILAFVWKLKKKKKHTKNLTKIEGESVRSNVYIP